MINRLTPTNNRLNNRTFNTYIRAGTWLQNRRKINETGPERRTTRTPAHPLHRKPPLPPETRLFSTKITIFYTNFQIAGALMVCCVYIFIRLSYAPRPTSLSLAPIGPTFKRAGRSAGINRSRLITQGRELRIETVFIPRFTNSQIRARDSLKLGDDRLQESKLDAWKLFIWAGAAEEAAKQMRWNKTRMDEDNSWGWHNPNMWISTHLADQED